jgi:hypothetical protein
MRKIFTIAILALSFNAFAQIPTNGLIGYWPFNGNANDESGNGNNGTVHGATLTIDRFGNQNSAYNFDGVTNFIETNSTIGNFGQSDFTISSWIVSLTGSLEETYIGKRSDGTYGNNWFGATEPTTRETYWDIDGDNTGTNHYVLVSNSILNTSNWYNIVFKREGNNWKIFINGVEDASLTTPTIQNINNTAPMTIGARYWDSNPVGYFTGQIDDVRIYNRALSSSEITSLFNEGLCFQTITVTDTLIINVSLTGFNPVNYANTIKIYPNPTNNMITIDCGNNFSTLNGYTIKITNSLSQTVYTSLINQQTTTIDLNTWTGKGIYFVHLIDVSNITLDIKKIVLQ